MSAAIALGLIAYILLSASHTTSPPPPRLTAVLAPVDAWPVWSIRYDPQSGRIQADAIQPGPAQAGQSYELWALPPDGGPLSLGILPPDRRTILSLYDETLRNPEGGLPLAVTLEPEGGSTNGQPSGPIIHTGRLELEPRR
jgi:anti-sigma-K factor RskA